MVVFYLDCVGRKPPFYRMSGHVFAGQDLAGAGRKWKSQMETLNLG
jgi:hypothetical protein